MVGIYLLSVKAQRVPDQVVLYSAVVWIPSTPIDPGADSLSTTRLAAITNAAVLTSGYFRSCKQLLARIIWIDSYQNGLAVPFH